MYVSTANLSEEKIMTPIILMIFKNIYRELHSQNDGVALSCKIKFEKGLFLKKCKVNLRIQFHRTEASYFSLCE